MVALIIFGTRGVRSTIKEGNFFCPQCVTQQNYKHKKVTQFFTLYFIPVIPLANKGTYVECQRCRNTYIERVLEMQPVVDITTEQELPPAQEGRLTEPAVGIAASSAVESSSDSATESVPDNTQSEKAILSEKQKAMRKLLIMMILADGKVEDAEIHMFHKVYKDLADDYVADIYKEIEAVRIENKQPHQYLREIVSFLNEEGKRDLLKASMMIAASDGDIDPSEVRMVEQFGRSLEMRPTEVREIIDSIKA